MIHITQCELQQLVGQDRSCIGKPEKRMVGEDSSKAHGSRVEDSLTTEATETGMAVDNLNLLSNHDIAENREEGKDGREGRFSVDHEEGDVVDLEAIGEVPNTRAALVCVCDDDHFMSSVDQFL